MSRLDSTWSQWLPYLAAAARRTRCGSVVHDRRHDAEMRRIELIGSRDYAPGDDYRRVDWYRCARHDELLTRQSLPAPSRPVRVLVDTSRRMGLGEPTKLDVACRIAGALAYVAFDLGCEVGLATYADRIVDYQPPCRDRSRRMAFAQGLAEASPASGSGSLETAAQQLARLDPARGIAVVVSDLLQCDARYEPRFAAGLSALAGHGYEVRVVQIGDPQELRPQILGEQRLVDLQHGNSWEGTITEAALGRYHRRVEGFLDQIARFCASRRMRLVRVWTDWPLAEMLPVALGLRNDPRGVDTGGRGEAGDGNLPLAASSGASP